MAQPLQDHNVVMDRCRAILDKLGITDYSTEMLEQAVVNYPGDVGDASYTMLVEYAMNSSDTSSKYELWQPPYQDTGIPAPIPEDLLPLEIIHNIVKYFDTRVYQLYLLSAKAPVSKYYRYAHLLPVHCMLHSIATNDTMVCDVIDKARRFTDIIPDDLVVIDDDGVAAVKDIISKLQTEDVIYIDPVTGRRDHVDMIPIDQTVIPSLNGITGVTVWGDLCYNVFGAWYEPAPGMRAWPVVLMEHFDFEAIIDDFIEHASMVDFIHRLTSIVTNETLEHMDHRIELMLMCRNAIREHNGTVDLANYLENPVYQLFRVTM